MKDFLNYAVRIGEQMLLSGAEVHRVEDCLERICRVRGGNTMQFLEKAGSALSIASALAGGIIVSAVFVRLLFKLRNIKFEGKMQ